MSAADEARDEAGRHLLGRERDDERAATRCRERFEVCRRGRADQRRIMHARFVAREKRSLEMKTEHRGLAAHRLLHGGDRRHGLLRAIGDQRREKAGGAEAAMRGGDRSDRLRGRRIVEQHVAAAIDLQVDEAGRKPGAFRQRNARHADVRPGNDFRDPRTVDHDGGAAMQGLAVEDAVRRDGELCGRVHRVRVTFCR